MWNPIKAVKQFFLMRQYRKLQEQDNEKTYRRYEAFCREYGLPVKNLRGKRK